MPEPVHPGRYIRASVIPSGLSVKDAAKLLGVGRPALSNMLNGKASLSPDMALRLEKAFGCDREMLLDLQTTFDSVGRRPTENRTAVRRYVPNFLTIKARQIHEWPDRNLDARHLLPVLLRKLIHSTGIDLRHVDFPGYDNAERKGRDGVLDAGEATAWIPKGKSTWEFGTNQNPLNKAERDYVSRVASISAGERAATSFVFVTPRNWPGKTEWATRKNAAGDWKAIRVLDASDLEQWLDESISAQVWLAEQLGLPTEGFETLDQSWERWAGASDPRLVPAIFEPSITAYGESFRSWLEKPTERPFVVAADSKEEALAFLACLFNEPPLAAQWKDLPVVFEAAQTMRALAMASTPFIPIVFTEEVERELAPLYRRVHCIIVRPRNAIDSHPDIALDLLSHQAFDKALIAMGLEQEKIDRLGLESGYSPTILRRRLSRIDAIRIPQWARDPQITKSLIPLALIGAWHATSHADREVISVLANAPYEDIEDVIARLLQFDDCPVWAAGRYRGVASKIDALFGISKSITEANLTDFLLIAEYALSEIDPALDLPEDKRWAAGIYGKVRAHSAALRRGICETLVILSIHGNKLFRERLGIDIEGRVSALIRRLLTPLTLDKLLSHSNDLPSYAEAAPEEFLTLIETDLQQSEPVVLGLLKPVSSDGFGGCPRSGLLWALERLAWKNLRRVSIVLAQLSRTAIGDNWMNKPIASLEAIYRSWLPQTAASLEDRLKGLEMLTKRFPDVGWQICMEQLKPGSRIGTYSARPDWRNDASAAGRSVTGNENYEVRRKALDLVLAWPSHDQHTLGDLVECLQVLPSEDQATVWDLVDAWADTNEDQATKAQLRERIRRFVFTHWGQQRGLEEPTKDRARDAYAKLEPHDVVIKHAWLFVDQWIDDSAEELEDEEFDYRKRDERIHQQRITAIEEIWRERRFEGITTLLTGGTAAHVVGRYLTFSIKGIKECVRFLQQSLAHSGLAEQLDMCMQGFLASGEDADRGLVIGSAAALVNADLVVRLLRCAPFRQVTWRLLDQYGEAIRRRYWQEVLPYWSQHGEAELIEIVDRLLEASRPRAAFCTVRMDWDRIETSRLKRLLLAVATVDAEPVDHYRLNQHDISEALDSLDGRTGVSPDEMAQLEFLFIRALSRSKHGIPNLEQQIAVSPTLFVQTLAYAYKRRDEREDPPEWQIRDPERREAVAYAAHSLLDQLKHLPGNGSDGSIDAGELLAWTIETRRLCAEHGRPEIGDQIIGQLFSKAPAEPDGSWPCRAVCEVMDRIAASHLATGFSMGTHNSRGAHFRGEGGAQERELATKYRRWAELRAFEYPFLSNVLERIASDYDREGEREDSETKIRRRLRHR